MEVIIYTIGGQLAVVGMLFRWLQVQIRDNKTELNKVYDKSETKEAIDLRIKPIEVGIIHVQSDVAEVKAMLIRLLNEKDK